MTLSAFLFFPPLGKALKIRKHDIINIDRMTMKYLSDALVSFHDHCEHMAEAKKKNLHGEQESPILWLHQNILQERKWLAGKTWEHYLLTLKQNIVFIFVHILTS